LNSAGHRAEEHHEHGFTDDLAAHHPVHMLLDDLDFAAHRFEQIERDDANIAVFDGNRIAAVTTGADTVQTERIAREMKTGDLLATVAVHQDGLE
jgi:hypothetical protein